MLTNKIFNASALGCAGEERDEQYTMQHTAPLF